MDFQLAALGGAAAFALAGVLALTARVTGLAAALPFTGVLSFAGVRALVPHGLERNSRGSWFAGCEGADGHRSGHQTGNSCARKECFRCIHFVLLVLLLSPLYRWPPATLRRPKFDKYARNDLLTEITLRASLWSLEIILSDRSPLTIDSLRIWSDRATISRFTCRLRTYTPHDD